MSRRSSPRKEPDRRPAAAPLATVRPVERRIWLYWVAIALLGSLAYANSLHGVFILDDFVSIVENPNIRAPWSPALLRSAWGESALLGRPLVALTFALNYAIHGLDVRGYHVVNIAVHVVCGLLLFSIIRRLRGSAPFAFACASLWVLHPLTTEVVDYISQRTESMMAMFYLLAVYASVRAHSATRAKPWLAMAIAASALGMLAKQSMLTIPLALLLVDYALFFDSLRSALRQRWRFYVAAGATPLLLGFAILGISPIASRSVGFASGPSPWVYLLNQSVIVTHYLALAVWPHNLVSEYGYATPRTLAEVLPQMAFVGGLLLLTAIALRYRPTLGLLGAWVFVTLAVTSSVAPIATEVGAERRMYVPLMALVVLAVVPFAQLSKHLRRQGRLPERFVAAACIVLWAGAAAALGARTAARNREYSSALRLATITYERRPTAYSRSWLGEELLLAGRRDEAIAHLREASHVDPRAHFTLGRALFDSGRLPEAREELEAFVRLRPMLAQAVDARFMIGRALLAEGRLDDAGEQFAMVLRMQPSFFDAHLGLGQVLAAEGRHADAVTQFNAYFEAGGRKPGVWIYLAGALAQSGRSDEAIGAYMRALEELPDAADAHRGLAAVLLERRDLSGAVQHADRAVTLNPDDAAARDLLGIALAAQGKMDLAAVQFQQALRLDPSDQTVREHLQQALRR